MLSYGGAVGPGRGRELQRSVGFICRCNKCSRGHLRHASGAVKGNVVITFCR